LSGTFSLGGLVNDPRDITILCQSCSLPGRLVQTGDYDSIGRNPRKYPVSVVDEDITFSFLLTNDYYVKKFFNRWQGSVIDPVTNLVSYPAQYKTDVIIQQLDRNNTPVYGVKLIGAYPTGVNSIELSNESADATHSLSVTMVYDRFEVEGAISSLVSGVKNKLGALRRLI
jgi:cobalamin biosynthesis Mg chelatase CobN